MSPSTFMRLVALSGVALACGGQTLTLDSTISTAGATISLPIRLSGGNGLSAVQWALGFNASDFMAVSITPSSGLAASGKAIACHASSGRIACVASGLNAQTIPDGTVATAALTLSAHSSERAVSLSNVSAATASGNLSPLASSGGLVGIAPPPVIPTQLTCTPSSVLAPATASCSVSISATAAAAGVPVTVTSDRSFVVAPQNVMVSSGSSSAGFSISISPNAVDGFATLTASTPGGSISFALSITTPPTLSSLSCDSTSLDSGSGGLCTVAINKAAPATGVTVAVATDNTNLEIPSSVAIPAGALSAAFNVRAKAVQDQQSAAVTVTLGSAVRSSAFTLLPPPLQCPCSLWSAEDRPVVSSASDTAAVELGVKFRSSVAGYVLGVKFYKGSGNTGTHSARLWTLGGQQLATVTFRNETNSGWQQANFDKPVPVAANTTYIVSYRAPMGRYAADAWYFSAKPVENEPLTALQTGQAGGNGVYRYGSVGFPNSTWNAANYWVDVVFNTAPSLAPSPVPRAIETAPMISRSSSYSTVAEDTPAFSVPDFEVLAPGEPLRFLAAATEADGTPMEVVAESLPKGAHYDRQSGWFEWIPGRDQEGETRLVFRAKGRGGMEKVAEVGVRVGGAETAAIACETNGEAARGCVN